MLSVRSRLGLQGGMAGPDPEEQALLDRAWAAVEDPFPRLQVGTFEMEERQFPAELERYGFRQVRVELFTLLPFAPDNGDVSGERGPVADRNAAPGKPGQPGQASGACRGGVGRGGMGAALCPAKRPLRPKAAAVSGGGEALGLFQRDGAGRKRRQAVARREPRMRKGDGRMRLAATLPPEKEAAAMNCLFDYLALRQAPQLSRGAVFEYFGGEPAQWLVLFGGSIPEGAELVAKAMREGVARRLMLVGGEGHTTQALRDHILPGVPRSRPKAGPRRRCWRQYLQAAHGCVPTRWRRAPPTAATTSPSA